MWSVCQCVLIKCLIGSALIDVNAFVILGRDTEKPASTRSLPSAPVKTAILPPEPSSTEILRRMGWMVIFAFAAALTIVGTIPCSFANSGRRASSVAPAETPAIARRRRRENLAGSNSCMIFLLPESSPCCICSSTLSAISVRSSRFTKLLVLSIQVL